MTHPRGTTGGDWHAYPELSFTDKERLAEVCPKHRKVDASCERCGLACMLARSVVTARREVPPPTPHAPPRACAMSGYSLTVSALRAVLNALDPDLPVLISDWRKGLSLVTFANRIEVEQHPTGYTDLGVAGDASLGSSKRVLACVLTRGRAPV